MPIEKTSFAVLDSHQRMVEREAARAENQRKDREAQVARLSRREKRTIEDRVETAVNRLRNANVSQTVAIIESCSSTERDAYLLAEEIGQNRKTVLRQFPAVRASVRASYEGKAPSSVAAPDKSPETVEHTEE